MKEFLHPVSNHGVLNRQLVDGLRTALDKNYSRIRAAAQREWERKFGSSDPSNACVSVRVSRNEALDKRQAA